MTYHRREHVIEDVSDLLAAGESPATIASRLSMQPGSVARALYRAGLTDTARVFEAARRSLQHKPCVDCGAHVSCRKAQRCRPCGFVQREITKRERVAA